MARLSNQKPLQWPQDILFVTIAAVRICNGAARGAVRLAKWQKG